MLWLCKLKMASLLRNELDKVVESFTVIDCRFPYEFSGGHIQVVVVVVLVVLVCKFQK